MKALSTNLININLPTSKKKLFFHKAILLRNFSEMGSENKVAFNCLPRRALDLHQIDSEEVVGKFSLSSFTPLLLFPFTIVPPPDNNMEVKSCTIVKSFNCIWFDKGHFNIEDVDFQRILQISKNQLRWFIVAISDLIQDEERSFFLT